MPTINATDDLPPSVTDRIERGHVFTTFHFPETRTNLLIGQPTMTPALAGAAGS